MDVLLHDARLLGRAGRLTDNILQLIPILGDLDTVTAISALSGLADPDVVPVSVLIVVLLEGEEVWIAQTLLNVECNGQRVERIITDRLIVVLHIHEQCLLVAKMVVVLDLVG